MENLQIKLRFSQHFSVAYCPWQNGAVEVMNKPVLKHLRQLCSEFSLQLDDWKEVIPVIEHAINNTVNPHRGNVTPNEIFLGFKHEQNLLSDDVSFYYQGKLSQKPFDEKEVLKHALGLRDKLNCLVERNYTYVEMLRSQARRALNKSRHHVVQFQESDWVMVSYHDTQRDTDKTRLKWLGPQMIEKIISDDVYLVSNVLGHAHVVHASRLWYYEGPEYKPSDAVREVFTRDFHELLLDKIVNHRVDKQSGNYEVLVQWLGFQDDFNSWEPVDSIAKTHAQVLRDYFQARKVPLPKILKQKVINDVQVLTQEVTARHWTESEKKVLKTVILKFGFGCWYQLRQLLPLKSYQQIYDHLQRYLFFMDFSVCNGLRFDVEKLRVLLELRVKKQNVKEAFSRSSHSLVRKRIPLIATPSSITRLEIESLCTEIDADEFFVPVLPNPAFDLLCFGNNRFVAFKEAIIYLRQWLVDERVFSVLRDEANGLRRAGPAENVISVSRYDSLE